MNATIAQEKAKRIRALKQIRQAADNLRDAGQERDRFAAKLLLHLANSLEMGAAYVVSSHAEAFDAANVD